MKTFFLLLLLVVLGAGGYAAWYVNSPVRMAAESVEVEVPQGTRLRGTLALLERSGVRVWPSHFEVLARLLGRERDIKAGNYLLTQPMTPVELLEKLTRGDVTQAEIRLIEGWTFSQFRVALDALRAQARFEKCKRIGERTTHRHPAELQRRFPRERLELPGNPAHALGQLRNQGQIVVHFIGSTLRQEQSRRR